MDAHVIGVRLGGDALRVMTFVQHVRCLRFLLEEVSVSVASCACGCDWSTDVREQVGIDFESVSLRFSFGKGTTPRGFVSQSSDCAGCR
jgi:hypothetical protein